MIQNEVRSITIKVDLERFSGIDNFAPGFIDQDKETIVGLQTDEPMKRIMNPYGGFRMLKNALDAYGLQMDPEMEERFNEYRKTHNQGVFDAYTKEMRLVRSVGLLTGLPDAYGRGRIIGDYRRVALYGVDFLKEMRIRDRESLSGPALEDTIKLREEMSEQIRALDAMKSMAAKYGYDIGRPARNAHEAVQWLYFAYLAAVKENNGAAMSLGRNTAFLDIYLDRDLKRGLIDEAVAQELIDQLVIKLRMVRFLRTHDYNSLFSGDPTWVTEAIGGVGIDGRPLVTKNSFRFLHTLTTLGPAPEPNLTVLWSHLLPQGFKDFCAQVSIDTSAVQYESDEIIRPAWGDDAAIACCVSPMRVGKQMQFFGARLNSAKALLYAINGGRDEMTGKQIVRGYEPIAGDEPLDFDAVWAKYDAMLDWVVGTYVEALNIIHYSHDKYAYEAIEMALHDDEIVRTMGCGIAGLSIVADSLAAIKYATVTPVRDDSGLVVDYITEGEFPRYGNDDDRADEIAQRVVKTVMDKIRGLKLYRDAVPTQSVLTITSNVVYGRNTGSFPCGHRAGTPFAPGANPANGADTHGMVASMLSVGKLDYDDALDGISLTNTITPPALGRTEEERIANLVGILDAGMGEGLYHANINVLNRETLIDAMEHPENYPQLTIRVSGYAVNFVKLTREQQLDVLSRTFHESV